MVMLRQLANALIFDLVIVVEQVPGLLQDVSETDLLLRWGGAS